MCCSFYSVLSVKIAFSFYNKQATKLRQDIYGENHSVTIGSLDYFAVVYAEVGKQQYSGCST